MDDSGSSLTPLIVILSLLWLIAPIIIICIFNRLRRTNVILEAILGELRRPQPTDQPDDFHDRAMLAAVEGIRHKLNDLTDRL